MKYEDLNDAAKEKAREWWKELEGETWGSDRAPDYYDDFITCLGFLGIEVKINTRVINGRKLDPREQRTVQEPAFQWSGFWSQGDGFVLEGVWRAREVNANGLMEYAPQDQVLHKLCLDAVTIMLREPLGVATITTVSAGPGLPYMRLGETGTDRFDNDGDELPMDDDDQKAVKDLVERACDWCYDQLESNYEYDTGDEAAEEAIKANEYEFDEDGNIGLAAHA